VTVYVVMLVEGDYLGWFEGSVVGVYLDEKEALAKRDEVAEQVKRQHATVYLCESKLKFGDHDPGEQARPCGVCNGKGHMNTYACPACGGSCVSGF
jgi:hypothetical protein